MNLLNNCFSLQVDSGDSSSSSSSSTSSSSSSNSKGEKHEKKNATSAEVMDEMVKKFKGLNSEKRRKILELLSEDNPKKAAVKNGDKSLEDEVEILDISEQKMGIYKRKRRPSPASGQTTSTTTTAPTTTSKPEPSTTESTIEKLLRLKRELVLKTVLADELNSAANEDENLAIEEGYEPDGIADHHRVLNQTTLFDRSNSEFWSSFSSSEEALLNCAGLILSLPLSPNGKCQNNSSHEDFLSASHSNTITYTVPSNGYYFFVFNSENEVQDNYIRVKFDIQKTVYNVSNSIQSCNNATDVCRLPLNFFSNQKVVFELPLNSNETLWNEEYVVISECEPRTAIYLVCVISVPLMILLFAFQ